MPLGWVAAKTMRVQLALSWLRFLHELHLPFPRGSRLTRMVPHTELVAALKLLSQAPPTTLATLLQIHDVETSNLCRGFLIYIRNKKVTATIGVGNVEDQRSLPANHYNVTDFPVGHIENEDGTAINTVASQAKGVKGQESVPANNRTEPDLPIHDIEDLNCVVIDITAAQSDSIADQDHPPSSDGIADQDHTPPRDSDAVVVRLYTVEIDQAQQSLPNNGAVTQAPSPKQKLPIPNRPYPRLESRINSTLKKWNLGMASIEAHLQEDVGRSLGESPISQDPRLLDIILSPDKNTLTDKMRSCLAIWTFGIELELFEKRMNEVSTAEQYVEHVEAKPKGGCNKFIQTQPESLQTKIRHGTRTGMRYRVLDGWAAKRKGIYGISILLGLLFPPLTSMAISEMSLYLDALLLTPTLIASVRKFQSTLKSLQVAYIGTSTAKRSRSLLTSLRTMPESLYQPRISINCLRTCPINPSNGSRGRYIFSLSRYLILDAETLTVREPTYRHKAQPRIWYS
jgi:hypothetical protein